ncbi:MAG: hypothetical protein ACNI3A_15170 [Desulfovibrio sp.]|uniref:hypothetical protein n=1 Tax=Desulfovibrio sp. 7SRBS1 TaxID=3378064 RepID=UPI003B3CE76F
MSETRVFKSRGGKAPAKGMADAYFLILEDMPLAQQRRHHEIFNALTGEPSLTGPPLFLTEKTELTNGM